MTEAALALNPMQVSKLKEPGRYHDGDGLMLDVRAAGSKGWIVRLQSDGKRRDYGLGSLKDVSLAEAREKAREYRKLLRSGLDPLEAKRSARPAVPTFRLAATQVHAEHKAGWRNSKHGAQWLTTLQTYVFPLFGDLSIDKVETGHVRDALAEIWLTKPETARRVRQRIGTVLDFAHGKGWREHPFSMSAVNRSLPKQAKQTGRFEAMPYSELPGFLSGLRERTSMGRLAVELAVLTAARSNEIRGARWSEFNLEAAVWTVPAERMKAGKEHKVPLSGEALDVLRRAAELRIEATDLVFYGLKRGRPLSDMTLLKVLRDMGLPFTVHGFRSTFRDWVAEQTNTPGEVAEAALAHAIPNKVEAAYRRTNYLEKRKALMAAWGAFSRPSRSPVIALRGA
jgi:integrase